MAINRVLTKNKSKNKNCAPAAAAEKTSLPGEHGHSVSTGINSASRCNKNEFWAALGQSHSGAPLWPANALLLVVLVSLC